MLFSRVGRALVAALVFTGTWAPVARAHCPAAPEQLAASAQRAAEAFASIDELGFATARGVMHEQVTCLSAPPGPAVAAAVHQTEALAWFLVKDHDQVRRAFAAMMDSDPAWLLSAELAPPGGQLHRVLTSATWQVQAERVPVALPEGYALYLDGRQATDRPRDRVALIVVTDPWAHVAWSALLPAGEPMPSFDAPLVSPMEPPPDGAPAPTRRPRGVAFASAGAGVAAGGLWLGYLGARAEVLEVGAVMASTSDAEAYADAGYADLGEAGSDALYRRARALQVGAGTATGLALALASVAVVWTW